VAHRAAESAELILPLGEGTAGAAAVFEAVQAKVDDYLRALPPRGFRSARRRSAESAGDGLRGAQRAPDRRGDAEVAALPLAAVEGGKALPLADGVNPAWAAASRSCTTRSSSRCSARDGAVRGGLGRAVGQVRRLPRLDGERPETAVHELDLGAPRAASATTTRARGSPS
jgi:hypothetical protein